MQTSNCPLVKHFTKPELGEYVPIVSIEMTGETIAWSPKLKQSNCDVHRSIKCPVNDHLKSFLEFMKHPLSPYTG